MGIVMKIILFIFIYCKSPSFSPEAKYFSPKQEINFDLKNINFKYLPETKGFYYEDYASSDFYEEYVIKSYYAYIPIIWGNRLYLCYYFSYFFNISEQSYRYRYHYCIGMLEISESMSRQINEFIDKQTEPASELIIQPITKPTNKSIKKNKKNKKGLKLIQFMENESDIRKKQDEFKIKFTIFFDHFVHKIKKIMDEENMAFVTIFLDHFVHNIKKIMDEENMAFAHISKEKSDCGDEEILFFNND